MVQIMGDRALRAKLGVTIESVGAFQALAKGRHPGNAMAGALATRLFGAEERRAARLRRTRRQTRMFEAQPSLRVCLAA